MKEDFDKHIKAKLECAEIAPSKDLWAKLESKLDAFEKPIEEGYTSIKVITKYGVAAAIATVAIALSFLFLNKNENRQVAEQVQLPTEKTDILLGEEMQPAVTEITVEEAKPMAKVAKHKSNKNLIKNEEIVSSPESLLAESDEVKSETEDFQIPMYSLKLNTQRTSPFINEKITVISGEPLNVEIDEDLNKRQILIYQRLQFMNYKNHHSANSILK